MSLPNLKTSYSSPDCVHTKIFRLRLYLKFVINLENAKYASLLPDTQRNGEFCLGLTIVFSPGKCPDDAH